MKQVRKTKLLALVLFIVYIAIGQGVALFTDAGEWFPIFNGHWFVRVPHKMQDYGVLITEVDGQILSTPTYTERAPGMTAGWRFAGYGTIQNLGRAIEQNDSAGVTKLRSFFENNFLKNNVTEYKIVRRTLSLLEFIKSSKVEEEHVLDTFRVSP